MTHRKEYLGDGAYVDFDGYSIILTAEDGIRATDRVYLDPEVLENFMGYVKAMKYIGNATAEVDSKVSETPQK